MCHAERLAAERRAQRRARLEELGRRAAVVALVAASGATGLGAAFLPDGPLCTASTAPSTVELRVLPDDDGAPVTLAPAAIGWGQPLAFRCYDVGEGVTCCIVAPR